MHAGTKKEWDNLIKLAERKGVKGLLNCLDDEYQDVNKLLQRKLKEKPFISKKPTKGKYKNYLIIGCIHRPHHSKKLWAKIMQFIYDFRKDLDGIIINGDYLEMEAISAYGVGKKGSGVTLYDEYEDGLDGLLEIESAFGKKKKDIEKHFLWGNHEFRWQKAIAKLEVSKYGQALLNPVDGLRLDELGYNVQMDYQNAYIQLGDNLEVLHGHYFSVHAAAKHLSESDGKDLVFNHTHRFQAFSKNGMTSYNIGCLIDLKSKIFNYASRQVRNNWINGFAIAHIDSNGGNIVTPIKCVKEGFFFWGKSY